MVVTTKLLWGGFLALSFLFFKNYNHLSVFKFSFFNYWVQIKYTFFKILYHVKISLKICLNDSSDIGGVMMRK